MSKTNLLSSLLGLFVVAANSVHAAERPTLNHTGDPRPDILPHPFYDAHTEYRRAYNRPRDIPGWITHKIAPESLEAMVWCENVQAGNYERKHMPPMCKTYYYPKPWEAMLTGARPDFAKQTQATSRRTPATPSTDKETQSGDREAVAPEQSKSNKKANTTEKSDAQDKSEAAVRSEPPQAASPSDDKEPSRLPLVPVPTNAVR